MRVSVPACTPGMAERGTSSHTVSTPVRSTLLSQ